jgi:hypothetical protein
VKSRPQQAVADRSQHDRPASCVVAQQYSSTTFVSLRVHTPKEQFGTVFKYFIIIIIIISFLFFFSLRNFRKLWVGVGVGGVCMVFF